MPPARIASITGSGVLSSRIKPPPWLCMSMVSRPVTSALAASIASAARALKMPGAASAAAAASTRRRSSTLTLEQPHRARLAGFVGVERGFPDRDLTIAHRPHLDPAPLHRLAGDPIFPPALPVIGDNVAGERAKLLLQPIILLTLHAAAEQLFKCRLALELRQVAKLDDAIFGESGEQR